MDNPLKCKLFVATLFCENLHKNTTSPYIADELTLLVMLKLNCNSNTSSLELIFSSN